MTEIPPDQLAALEQQLNGNPGFVQDFYAMTKKLPGFKSGGKMPSQLLRDLYQKWGVTIPKDYELGTAPGGGVKLSKVGFYDRNSDWIPAAVIGGAFGGSGLLGGGFGAPGAAGAGAGAGGVGSGGAAAGTAGLTAAQKLEKAANLGLGAADASGGLGGILKKLIPGLAGLGALGATHALAPPMPKTPMMLPEQQAALSMAMKRLTDQQPLYEQIMRQASAGLPKYTRSGGQG